uniref:Uncharacterized protein n=1 Tax=Zea mays TaxID=4577 RepID=A0A804PVR9_MAIZE
MAPFLLGSNGVAEQQHCPLLPGMQQSILLSSPTKQRAPSSLFSVVPAGCSTKCAASHALQQPSHSFSTPLIACRRSRARCATPSVTSLKPVTSTSRFTLCPFDETPSLVDSLCD